MNKEHTNGNRTHEPSLRELTAELDGMRALMDERDRWYTERDKNRREEFDKAIAAVDKQTAIAFAAAKEAGAKLEQSQNAYNATHNDLSRKNEKLVADTMSTREAEGRFKSLDEKITELKLALTRFQERTGGASRGMRDLWGWIVAAVMAGVTLFSVFGPRIK